MSRITKIQVPPEDALALVCLIGLTVGVGLVGGLGWALIVVSGLVLLYLLIPDQRAKPE